MASDLGVDVASVIWVSQAYLLARTVGLLLIGRISDVNGRVRIYNIGVFGTLWAHFQLKEISTKDVKKKMGWNKPQVN